MKTVVSGQKVNHGTAQTVQVKRAYPFAGGGNNTQLPFDTWMTTQGELEFCVFSFTVRLPTMTVTSPTGLPAAASALDGIAYGQIFGRASIVFADGAPANFTPAGRVLFQTADMREMEALSYMSGQAVFIGKNGSYRPYDSFNGALNTGPDTSFQVETRQIDNGPLQAIGPFAIVPANAVNTLSFRPEFCFPVGARLGEQYGRNLIPARWFTGSGIDCNCASPGYIEVQPAQGINIPGPVTLAITWGSEGVDVFANGFWMPRTSITHPLIPHTRRTPSQEGEFKLMRYDVLSYHRLMPDLTNTGGMPNVTYPDFDLQSSNVQVVSNDSHTRAVQQDFLERLNNDGPYDLWRHAWLPNSDPSAGTLAGYGGAARFSKWGETVIMQRGSVLRMVGDPTQGAVWKSYGGVPAGNVHVEGGFFGPNEKSMRAHKMLYGFPLTTPDKPVTTDGSAPNLSTLGALPLSPQPAQTPILNVKKG